MSAVQPERLGTGDKGGPRPPASAEVDQAEKPQIYVASLSDYNAGRLHGTWLDPAQDLSDLREDVQAMLSSSRIRGAEEFAIHDYAGFGRHVMLGEYTDIEQVHALARGMKGHGMAFAGWWSYVHPGSRDEHELVEMFEQDYLGTWGTVEDFAEQRLDDLGAVKIAQEIPTWLQHYLSLDFEAYARDLIFGGDIVTVEDVDGIHIFEGNAG